MIVTTLKKELDKLQKQYKDHVSQQEMIDAIKKCIEPSVQLISKYENAKYDLFNKIKTAEKEIEDLTVTIDIPYIMNIVGYDVSSVLVKRVRDFLSQFKYVTMYGNFFIWSKQLILTVRLSTDDIEPQLNEINQFIEYIKPNEEGCKVIFIDTGESQYKIHIANNGSCTIFSYAYIYESLKEVLKDLQGEINVSV